MTHRPADTPVAVDMEPLMEATRVINALIVKSLATVDQTLNVPQLRVMVILTDSDGASLSEVAEELGVNPSNASRACEQLVKRGLIRREEDPEDRRRLSLTLSPAGRRLVRRVMDRRRSYLAAIVAGMPDEGQQALMTALEGFNAVAEEAGVSGAAEDGVHHHRLIRWLG